MPAFSATGSITFDQPFLQSTETVTAPFLVVAMQ